MRRQIICWSVILLTCCCLAYSDTPGWDPGPPIQGPVIYVSGQYPWEGTITVYVGQEAQFWGGGSDPDHQADPIQNDGLHCEWSYVPAYGGNSVDMGKTHATDGCTCPGYEADTIEHTWTEKGTYFVTCKMDDCHIWADDLDSKELTFVLFCVDPCSFSAILVPPVQ